MTSLRKLEVVSQASPETIQKAGRGIDGRGSGGDDGGMTDAVSRPELDAKLEAIEARMDGRIATLTGRIDVFLSRIEERDKRIDDRFKAVADDVHDTKAAVGNLKTTIVVTAISAALATVFGVAAFNATVLSNMVASFESGKNTATALTQATEQLKQTQAQIMEELAAPRRQPAEPVPPHPGKR